MILTVTPNPSLDLLFGIERLVWDDANRTAPPRRRVGGQGINVVRAGRALDSDASVLAVAPLGGEIGGQLQRMLDAEGTPHRAVPIEGETRVFVGTRETSTGRALLLNPRGPRIGREEEAELLAAVESAVEAYPGPDTWVAGCGSLLPGLDDGFYARVGRLVRARGARFVPDCDGAPLAAAAHEADLLVPNEMEAARLAGRAIRDPGDAVAVARLLYDRGTPRVVVTLADRGAVAVTGSGCWWARPEPPQELADRLRTGSAVGAGDAFLAALLLGELEGAADFPATLARAVAAGTAALLSRDEALVEAERAEEVLPYVRVERM